MQGAVFASGGSLVVVYSGYQACFLVGGSFVGDSLWSRSSYVGSLPSAFRVSRVSCSLSTSPDCAGFIIPSCTFA